MKLILFRTKKSIIWAQGFLFFKKLKTEKTYVHRFRNNRDKSF